MSSKTDPDREVTRQLRDILLTPIVIPSVSAMIYRRGLKRLLDIALVLISIPAVLPFILMLAILVARDGGSPFYSQLRVGRGGRVFRMWKLRSMIKDADAALLTHLASDPEARREWEANQKLKRDPRITPFGRFLRQSSLDELPQLWNVLVGDMSLVGPRPMLPSQRTLYPGTAYYRMRPGMTGLWQVTDRNNSSFADRAKYDAQYGLDLSPLTDIKLLLSTVKVVMRATGH